MNCKICSSTVNLLFEATLLMRYEVKYYQCTRCDFIQTENPYWLEEAYSSAITSLDIGLLHRNLNLSTISSAIISKFFYRQGPFIDYGGGYGVFTRLMRDKGFDFYRQDIFCDNIFAKNFDVSDNERKQKFELATSFEVFEHLNDPIREVSQMLTYSNNIFFSTELVPAGAKAKDDWWYFMPETGQHIAFHTTKSLEILASKFNLNFYSNGKNIHLFTDKRISKSMFKMLTNYRWAFLYQKMNRRPSLLDRDYGHILNNLPS